MVTCEMRLSMITGNWFTDISVSCEQVGCQKSIKITGRTWADDVRQLRAAGWSYTAGRWHEEDIARCPDHRRSPKDVAP